MIKILPALLGDRNEILTTQFNKVALLSDVLHYDITDGVLVSPRTLPPSDYPQPRADQKIVWHLMVDELSAHHLEDCLRLPTQAVIIHAEAAQLPEMIDALLDKKISIGLALNPETAVSRATPWLKEIAFVQLMTVYPGTQGGQFIPSALEKIPELRTLHPELPVGIDGGVNRDTIRQIAVHHPDFVVVGSALTKADDPVRAYQELEEALQ